VPTTSAYLGVFAVALVVTLVATPACRWLASRYGVVAVST